MHICSFLPAATHTLFQLGLANHVVGATFECPGNKPKVVRSRLEERTLDAGGIDAAVASAQKEGHSLYYIDEDLLAELAPDLIFTQDVCPVCQIDTEPANLA
jgi:iron complex transport system substrate-binding protein